MAATEDIVKVIGSLMFVSFIVAVVAALLYFLDLPILSERDVSWIIVYGLCSLGVSGACMGLYGIWSE